MQKQCFLGWAKLGITTNALKATPSYAAESYKVSFPMHSAMQGDVLI